jgi:SAM-dependent methyltransferase
MIGLDRSVEGLQRTRAHSPETPLIAADVVRKPLTDGSFNAVISSGVIEHLVDGPAQALEEVRRVLAPRGLLFLAVPFNNSLRRFLYHPAMTLIRWCSHAAGVEWNFAEYRFTAGEIRSIVEKCGFEWEGHFVDEFRAPRAKGIWIDYNQLLGRRGRAWELNAIGRSVRRLLNAVSPWLSSGGIFCVARKGSR